MEIPIGTGDKESPSRLVRVALVARDFLSDSIWHVVAHDYLLSGILFLGVAMLPKICK